MTGVLKKILEIRHGSSQDECLETGADLKRSHYFLFDKPEAQTFTTIEEGYV